MEELLEETNILLRTLVDFKEKESELLTIKQIHKEFGIGVATVQRMFKDPELPVQVYTHPMKVSRKAFLHYIESKRHDYLSNKEDNK